MYAGPLCFSLCLLNAANSVRFRRFRIILYVRGHGFFSLIYLFFF